MTKSLAYKSLPRNTQLIVDAINALHIIGEQSVISAIDVILEIRSLVTDEVNIAKVYDDFVSFVQNNGHGFYKLTPTPWDGVSLEYSVEELNTFPYEEVNDLNTFPYGEESAGDIIDVTPIEESVVSVGDIPRNVADRISNYIYTNPGCTVKQVQSAIKRNDGSANGVTCDQIKAYLVDECGCVLTGEQNPSKCRVEHVIESY